MLRRVLDQYFKSKVKFILNFGIINVLFQL